MSFLLKKSGLIFLLFCSVYVQGQVRFSTTLHPAVINRDEETTIRFLLENANNVQNIIPPSFNNFILVSGPFQESGMTNISGSVSNYLAISFVIKPRKPGKFQIPGAVAKVGNKNYKSNAVSLTIKKTYSGNSNPQSVPSVISKMMEPRPMNSFNDYIFKKGEDVVEKVNKNMHLRLEVNKTSCYVGQPVIATYKLYTRLKSESKLTQNPSFNGFSVIDLQPADVTESTIGKLNGRDYNVYTIRKAQLYPLQDGTIELETAELENNIQFIRDAYAQKNIDGFGDIFDNFANATVPAEGVINQKVVLKSKPVTIEVKPLPTTGKPHNFKGAVGDLAIEAALEKSEFSQNESGKLIVMISGTGNLQLITPPAVQWPSGIEAFDSKSSDIFSMTSVPLSGKKVFEFPFSVDKPGDYLLPAIQLSYFDPQKEIYKTVSTNELTFTVTKGHPLSVLKNITKKPVVQPTFSNLLEKRKLLVIIIATLILAGLIYYFIWDRRRKIKSDLIITSNERAINEIVNTSFNNQINPLEKSERCLQDPECVAFYSLLMEEIKTFLSSKLSIPAESINKKSLAEHMDKLNISNETVLSLQDLLQELEWQLYTPFERNEKMEIIYSRSLELVQMINTYDIKHL